VWWGSLAVCGGNRSPLALCCSLTVSARVCAMLPPVPVPLPRQAATSSSRSSAWVEHPVPQTRDPTSTLGASPSLHVHPVSLGLSAPSLHVTLSAGSPCPVSPNHGRSRQPTTTTPHPPRGAPTREIDITLPYVCKFFDPPTLSKRLRCGKTMPSRLKTGS
jgi:hypothetical protein